MSENTDGGTGVEPDGGLFVPLGERLPEPRPGWRWCATRAADGVPGYMLVDAPTVPVDDYPPSAAVVAMRAAGARVMQPSQDERIHRLKAERAEGLRCGNRQAVASRTRCSLRPGATCGTDTA